MAAAPIRLAIIGAGLFARDAHAPALKQLKDQFRVAAVCSRTEASARALAGQFDDPVEIFTDVDALLAREDIEAVDILLPIELMPEIVEKALLAGKHVLSEKPVAPTVERGRALLAVPTRGIWMVAENWRYMQSFYQAAERLEQGALGRPLTAQWHLAVGMQEENKYYQTSWRRDNSFPGGFLMDGGVHYIAALRGVLGEIVEVRAFADQFREDLPPTDTIVAALKFESGTLATLNITFAPRVGSDGFLQVNAQYGWLKTQPGKLEIQYEGQHTNENFEENAIHAEMAAFAGAIRHGQAHRGAPEQALQDVAVIEAMLRSAATGQSVQVERIVP